MSRVDEIAKNRTAQEMYEIGMEYLEGMNGWDDNNGSVTVKMPTTAIKYFTNAAERGHVLAQYELACMYKEGIGCEADYDKAIRWYIKAAKKGHKDAKDYLEELQYEHEEGKYDGNL